MIVLFREAAETDLAEVLSYYEQIDANLTLRFQDEFESAVLRVVENPEAFQVAYAGLHRVRLRRFPHALYFRIVRDVVVFVAVMHPSRHESAWQNRR